eukprot:TRINITY_DN33173_c0_g1_i1.p1 TRINITY_DN33173_c0_g1~~TRINITY_DN33173_c0_g1_i1.p1  ORF type:complete len:663 (+),score=105.35 TRINITY_DN33173_c0_g1_i1:362-2350(+)
MSSKSLIRVRREGHVNGAEVVMSAGTGNESITSLERHDANESMLARGGGEVFVNACGRTVSVNLRSAQSITELQDALQHILQMEGQTFQFFDANGTTLATDMQIRGAISQGFVPLCASLTDASIHYIENRREELAQMQWKLVRDQMTGTMGKITHMSRQVEDMQQLLEMNKRDMQAALERLRGELFQAIETERDIAQTELREHSEHVNAIGQLVNGERNRREIAIQGLEKHIQGTRDAIDVERTARRQELAAYQTSLDGLRAICEEARCARTAFEDKHTFDISTLSERIDAASRHNAKMFQDQAGDYKTAHAEMTSAIHHNSHQLTKLRGQNDGSNTEATIRFNALEERCASIELRMGEAASRQAASLERLCERHERMSESLHGLRLEERQHENDVNVALERVKGLESTVLVSEGETRDMVLKELAVHQQMVKHTRDVISTEQKRQMDDLERKLGDRLERELSTDRERSMSTKSLVDAGSKKNSPRKVTPLPINQVVVRQTSPAPSSTPPSVSVCGSIRGNSSACGTATGCGGMCGVSRGSCCAPPGPASSVAPSIGCVSVGGSCVVPAATPLVQQNFAMQNGSRGSFGFTWGASAASPAAMSSPQLQRPGAGAGAPVGHVVTANYAARPSSVSPLPHMQLQQPVGQHNATYAWSASPTRTS